jgi:nicotinate phosphoribosyltransferase
MNWNFNMNQIELLTDFYELTMAQGYYFNGPDQKVVFDYFIRKNPFANGYTVFAGLGPLLEKLENFQFDVEAINYLQKLNRFKPEFLDYLKNIEFICDIFAVKEGEIVFPNEPIVVVTGPIIQAQIIESLLLNSLNFQSLIATKTSRIIQSAKGKSVLEFGLRRAQGVDGALSGTRASFIGGCAATSNTLAGKNFNIPVSGTMAHSWVMSFETELEAFERFADLYPDNCILLVDTYDTIKSGIPNAIKIFSQLKHRENANLGIRLDSGDLDDLSRKARQMFNDAGLNQVKIYISSELDELIIDELLNKNCPIDAFGVGTKLITGNPDASLSGVYKLAAKFDKNEDLVRPVIKISDALEKRTNPGFKNVLRFFNAKNQMEADLIYLNSEEEKLIDKIENGKEIRLSHQFEGNENFWVEDYNFAEKLLKPVMVKGKIIQLEKSLTAMKQYKEDRIKSVPDKIKRFVNPHTYTVGLSDDLALVKSKLVTQSQKK